MKTVKHKNALLLVIFLTDLSVIAGKENPGFYCTYPSPGRPQWLVWTLASLHYTPYLWTAGSRCQDPVPLLHPAPSVPFLVCASTWHQTPLWPSSPHPPPPEPEAFWFPQRPGKNGSRRPGVKGRQAAHKGTWLTLLTYIQHFVEY